MSAGGRAEAGKMQEVRGRTTARRIREDCTYGRKLASHESVRRGYDRYGNSLNNFASKFTIRSQQIVKRDDSLLRVPPRRPAVASSITPASYGRERSYVSAAASHLCEVSDSSSTATSIYFKNANRSTILDQLNPCCCLVFLLLYVFFLLFFLLQVIHTSVGI